MVRSSANAFCRVRLYLLSFTSKDGPVRKLLQASDSYVFGGLSFALSRLEIRLYRIQDERFTLLAR